MRFALAVPLSLAVVTVPIAFGQGFVTRQSVTSSGAQASSYASEPVLSRDGSRVAFSSSAATIVPGDTNNYPDAFVRNRVDGTVVRVSVASSGAQANQQSYAASLSGDGRFVGFVSEATNLVAFDTGDFMHAYVHDTALHTTELVGLGDNDQPASLATFTNTISADGRWVVFSSGAPNLVAIDTNKRFDVFVRDRQLGTTTLVSVSLIGVPANNHSRGCADGSISADGRYVAFTSLATDIDSAASNGQDHAFVRDMLLGATVAVSAGPFYTVANADDVCVSDDGRFALFGSFDAVFPGDTNGKPDVFLRDLVAGATERVSVDSAGAELAYSSWHGHMSSDARFVSFASGAPIAPGDNNATNDVYLRDRAASTTTLVSHDKHGQAGDGWSSSAMVSDDGRWIAYLSNATDLITGDTNNDLDVFLLDRLTPSPAIYCTAKTNSLGCVPAITFAGAPSASSSSAFTVGAQAVLNNRPGFLFYGLGAVDVPFEGGRRCVAMPVRRTASQFSGGNAVGDDCSGTYALDFNARIQSGIDPALVAGSSVHTQYRARDVASASTTSLTDALAFTIAP